jgi:hypothetical protein
VVTLNLRKVRGRQKEIEVAGLSEITMARRRLSSILVATVVIKSLKEVAGVLVGNLGGIVAGAITGGLVLVIRQVIADILSVGGSRRGSRGLRMLRRS